MTSDTHQPEARWNPQRTLGLTAGFALLTAVMTWPQVLVLKTHAVDHQDVFFNLWRLRWIAHALAASPGALFNGNVFYPETGVLAFSDAMLVEGVLAAPLFWIGVPPVLLHNLWLVGPIVASSVGITLLARHLTGNTPASMIAGIVFAFAPYRFEHYMHMELQWTVWIPWAFWALQRTIESGKWRFGLLMGVFVALQMASSVYYGVFLILLSAVVGALQLLTVPRRRLMRTVGALLLGGAVAGSASWLYSRPYTAASTQVGFRSMHEVKRFSAQPRDYRVATPTNLLYGPALSRSERRLSPGILAVVLALAGLMLLPPTPTLIAYLTALAVAFELSLGANGYLYPFLYEYTSVFRGLRAPARASVYCLFFVAVLAAYATAALTRTGSSLTRWLVSAVICAGLLLEYRVAPLELIAYPNDPPALFKVLARLPTGVVAEFPMPKRNSPPYQDPRYAYMSTFHWMPLVNGYSGFYPRSYLNRLVRLADFPDPESVASLRRENVRYVIIHDEGDSDTARLRMVEHLLALGVRPLGEFADGWSRATLMELQ